MSSSSSKSSPLVVQTIDIGEYIDNIESKLLESINNGKTTYRRKLSEPNRKPMIRTLLGYPNKVEFDEAIRIASNRIEYERIVHFYQNTLLPQLDDSTSSSSSQQLWKVHVPDLKDRILQALDQSMTFDKLESTSSPSLLSPFRRLATGPRYKGKTLDMLQDLFPTPSSSSSSSTSSKSSFSQQRSDVVQAYIEATKPLTESEILESVCESRRLYLEQTDRNHPQLLDTALYLCTCNFGKNGEDNEEDDDDGTNGDVVCPIQSGKDCEKACYEYLQQQQREVMTADTNEQDLPNNNIVLQNVYIKTYNNAIEKNLWNDNNSNDDDDDGDSNNSRRNRQIIHYQRQQRQKQQKKQGQRRNNGNVRTGTIWTSLPRKNTCSEFDVIVVNPTTNCVVEIWEAKKSMSPSSLWDAITGKLTALQQLIQDDTSILVYDINDEDNNADSSSGVDVANSSTDSTLPMSMAYLFTNDNDVDDEQDDDDTDNVETTTRRRNIITFGMFGLELLPVPRAIGQLLAMCAASIVSDVNNTQVIVEAVQQQQQVQQQEEVDNGHVVDVDVVEVEINVETHSLLNDIQILKSKYNEAIAMKDNFCCNNNVNIVLQILTNTTTTTTTTQSTNQNDSSNQASSKRGGTIK